jgi:ribonuclease P protein component
MPGSVVSKKESKNEAHLSALRSSQKTHSRLPSPHAHPRRSRGHSRTQGPRPSPPFGLRSSSQFGFSREQRLRRKAQITSVLARGRSTGGGGIQLHSAPSDSGPRLGVIAGRHAWPRAVDRNRFRRMVREAFRLLQHRLQPRDYILRVRNPQRGEPSGAEIEKLLVAWCKTDGKRQA